MAIYYLRMKTFGRSRGKSGSRATSAAAYRSGERIRDERSGQIYDHRRRPDVMHKEIVLPAQLTAERDALAWARDRTKLWNAAEHTELRRDSRVAREFVVALPHELAPAARTQLAMQFAQEIADRYRGAVDVAIHAPRGDARNFHAHLLATTREITPEGLGRKTTLELSGTQRHERGLPRWREEIESLRKHWADLTNEALERAHVATRVTHLSRAQRGLPAADASPRVPLAAYHMEQRGERSFIAEKIRERHRAELERVRPDRGAPAPERTGPERREPGVTASIRAGHRTLAGIGRSMFREIGAGVRAAWRELQERLGPHVPPGSVAATSVESGAPASRGKDTEAAPGQRADAARGIAGEHRAAAVERGVKVDEALRSAQRWLAYRERERAREAAGLESGGASSGRDRESERQHARERGHGFSL